MERLFDLRFVIGVFFSIAGMLLFLYSLAEGAAINRYCGILFLLFGILMVILTFIRPVRDVNTEEAAEEILH